jgi:tyrosyl-tRNA synthetase
MPISIDQQIHQFSRRCERILSEADLRKKLENSAKSGKPLRIKLGMDPTAPDVTLGHAVPLKVIRQFQDWGHKAVLIIGDVTGRVGDPSGVNTTRPMLTQEQVAANAQTYIQQVGKVLLSDADHLEIRYNGEWLAKMDIFEIIRLAGRKTVAQMLQRDSFKDRYDKGVDIHLHEFIYPLLQGWDSVMIDADVEMGGSDQLFNNLVGREFQMDLGKEGQVVMVTPLLVGTDGVMKMSKSKGNYIAVTDPASGSDGMFGKIMRLPDHLLENYYTLLTEVEPEVFKPLVASKPRDSKVELAKIIISWLHDVTAAAAAEADWNHIHDGGLPTEMPEILVEPGAHPLAGVMVQAGMVSSNSEANRKIKEGAVKIDGQKVADHRQTFSFEKPAVLQLGNRRFVRVRTR